MERKGNTYEEFQKIILYNYSPEKICLTEYWADEMFKCLDYEQSSGLEWGNENLSSPYWETEWDFPEPPEIAPR